MIVTLREIREENSLLKRADKGLVTFRDAATRLRRLHNRCYWGLPRPRFRPVHGYRRHRSRRPPRCCHRWLLAALLLRGNGKSDYLQGLKENVIPSNLIPACLPRHIGGMGQHLLLLMKRSLKTSKNLNHLVIRSILFVNQKGGIKLWNILIVQVHTNKAVDLGNTVSKF